MHHAQITRYDADLLAELAAHTLDHSQVDRVRAWTVFWNEQRPDSRCLQTASPQTHRILDDHWNAFGSTLERGTSVLDLGCGTGVVARLLGRAHPHLGVIGVDSARVAAASAPNVRIVASTAMESLPFRDGSVGAAVSQFGFEYSDVSSAATELARVLAVGGRFSFVVHHSQSAIVRANRIRNCALQALTSGSVARLFVPGDAVALGRYLSTIESHYGSDSTVRLAVRALRSSSVCNGDERMKVWRAITDALGPERILSSALETSCVAPAALDEWLQPLRAWFDIRRSSPLSGGAEPLAWRVEGVRIDRHDGGESRWQSTEPAR